MRMTVRHALLSISLVVQAAGAHAAPQPPGDLAALERAWHDCVRESFRSQPAAQGRAGAQRNALDACQAHEDAYVAAVMQADLLDTDRAPRRGLTDRVRAWASSMAAEVLDPVSSWLKGLRR